MRIASRNVTAVFGLALAIAFLWLALRDVDLASVRATMLRADIMLVLPFVIALAIFYWLKAVRWGHILNPKDPVSAKRLMPSMMVGFAGNNVLPARLGELIRIYLAARDLDLPKSQVLGTIVLERIFDAATILIILVTALYFLAVESPELNAAAWFLLFLMVAGLTATFSVAFSPRWLQRLGHSLMTIFPEQVQRRLMPHFTHVQSGFSILRETQVLYPALANSLIQWLLLATCIYVSIAAFDVAVPPLAALVVMGLIVAGISLPGAPGFVGTIEYCFVVGLGFFDVGPTEALSVAIFYHVLIFSWVVLVGGFYMRRYGATFRQLKEVASDVQTK